MEPRPQLVGGHGFPQHGLVHPSEHGGVVEVDRPSGLPKQPMWELDYAAGWAAEFIQVGDDDRASPRPRLVHSSATRSTPSAVHNNSLPGHRPARRNHHEAPVRGALSFNRTDETRAGPADTARTTTRWTSCVRRTSLPQGTDGDRPEPRSKRERLLTGVENDTHDEIVTDAVGQMA